MANTDNSEWRLLDVDTVTHLAVLPIGSSHLYQELNAPGSGELKIPLDSAIAADISEGMFCQLRYRGSIRDGFFIENIQETEADPGEGESRWLSVSGRGALALLDRAQVWADSTGASSREFTSVTKAYILKTLIDEAQARGALANLTYDFTATQDSSGAAWSDSENYTIPVGKKLLELAKQFASTGGFDFSLDLSAGTFNLHAYLAGVGTDKSSTIYFRMGEQAEEVGQDQRAGPDLVNAFLIRHQQGYSTVEDPTSIAAHGRSEGFLNLEQAQSSASAVTYASAKLELYKDPLHGKTLKVYDGVAPRLFVDYVLGDTVSTDKLGVESSDRILGIKADFDGVDFSHVVLEMNYIFQEEDVKLANELDNLLTDWNTARDANLLEVMEGLPIGANGFVNSIHAYGDYIYIGGGFTLVNGVSSSYTIRYQISSHTWTELTGISAAVIKIVDVAGTIYACTSTKVYVLSGTAWTLVGTASGTLRCMTSDGTSLYVGGSLTLMDAVTINGKVAKRTAGVWTDMEPNPIAYFAESIEYFNGAIHVGFGGVPVGSSSLKYMSGGSYSNALNLGGKYVFGLKKVGNNLIILSNDNNGGSASTCTIYSWDGVSVGPGIGSAVVLGTITDFLPVATGVGNGSCAITNYLTDVYVGADFDTLDGVTGFNGVAKYSGGVWTALNGGVSSASGDGVTTVEIVGNDLYAGGIFTTAFGVITSNLSVFITDFQSLVDHLTGDQPYNFDMGAAIHSATASAVTDNDEFPFWEDTAKALRKITWSNIKVTLKTYLDTLYQAILTAANLGDFIVALTGKTTPVDADSIVLSDSAASDDAKKVTWANVKSTLKTYFDTLYAAINYGVVPYTSTANVYRSGNPSATSTFTALINGAPTNVANSVVTFDTISAGNATVITPSAAGQLAKMRLYNNTRSNYALVVSVSGSTVVMDRNVTTLPSPWQDNDSISTLATGATIGAGGGGINYAEVEITDATLMGKSALLIEMTQRSSVANEALGIHPYTAYIASKEQLATCTVANIPYVRYALVPLTSNVLGIWWNGTGNTASIFKVVGYQP